MNDAPAKQNNPMAATKLKSTGPLTASANTINSSAEDMAHSLAELRERLRDYGLLSPARTAADAPDAEVLPPTDGTLSFSINKSNHILMGAKRILDDINERLEV